MSTTSCLKSGMSWLNCLGKGIGYSIYYPKPLHLQKCFEYLGYREGDFPAAEKVCREIIALPMYPELEDREIDHICETVAELYGKKL